MSTYERLLTWTYGSAGTALLMAGLATLVATWPVLAMAATSEMVSALAAVLMQLGGVFIAGGLATTLVLRSTRALLPNERVVLAEGQRIAFGGWLTPFVLTLIVAPGWLLFQLLPFLSEWRTVLEAIAVPGWLGSANTNMSGALLIPLAGALMPPFLLLVTTCGYVMVSLTLVPLLAARSPRLPRLYVASLILLSSTLLASTRATSGALEAGNALRQEIERTSVNVEEAAMLQAVVDRYVGALRTATPPLRWTWLAYAMWIPVLIASRRTCLAFGAAAPPAERRLDRATDVEAITRPPGSPSAGA